ncbi:unnamed protein product [Schistosoma turkestanicum]|nr:unnamed protein product [Schistosoma turkestanicum]
MEDSGGIDLTSDEITRLKKAFKDPEFQKLFREYAEEIADPANKKKYEDEIKMMELEQGMDVVFVNPTPGHCLKTRHWPGVLQCPESRISDKDESNQESVKVFINVCKSDKLQCPEMKPTENDSSRQGKGGVYWSLPHCFTPPREDIDKAKQRAMVYDVAFNPKAFELAESSVALRRLLDTTAVEGVQKQYNLCFGKTFAQARQLFDIQKGSESGCSRNGSSLTDSAREDYLLKAVHVLKGVSYKGVSRPTVIRRRRSDYEERQTEIKRRETEDLKLCHSEEQKQAIKMLSSFPNCGNLNSSSNGTNKSDETVESNNTSSPTKPDYSITYSSDFDLSDCTYSNDVNPLRPPDRLKINISLPGIRSSSCVDLEVTKTHIHLSSHKPIAYLLDLKLPYEVNDADGTAKFDKSTHTLCVTLPIIKNMESAAATYKPVVSSINSHDEKDAENETKTIEYNSTTNTSDHESVTPNETTGKHSRKKRRKRRTKSKIVTESSIDASSDGGGGSTSSKCSNVNLSPSAAVVVVDVDKSVIQTENKSEQLTNTHESLSEIEQNKENVNKITKSQTLPSTVISLSTSPGVEIKVNQISSCEMILSKDRRLAPVRFRQDPFSLTILLDVRGILPNSIVINWTNPMDFNVSSDNADMLDSSSSSSPSPSSSSRLLSLLLLITFSSCGSGGFTMDWGIVLHCPSSVTFNNKFEHSLNGVIGSLNSHRSGESSAPPAPPQIISCHISPTNGVLIIRKPSCNYDDDDLSMNKKFSSEMLSNRAVWWASIATGRTLTGGMQECSFIGMEAFTSYPRHNNFLSTNVNKTSNNCCQHDVFPSTQLINNQSIHKNCTLLNEQSLKSINVISLSNECCSIEWDPTVESVNAEIDSSCNITKTNDSCFASNHQSNLINEHPDKLHVINDNNRSNNNNNNKFIVKRHRYNSTPGNPGQTGSVLKSILKQRSISESSVDETIILEGNILRDAGLAGTTRQHSLISDEFPTEYNDENHDIEVFKSSDFQRSISSDKLLLLEGTTNHLPLCRQRSVSFCQRDQHVDFSPGDTVETLHHTLHNIRRNLRRRDARRRRATNGFLKQANNCESIPSKIDGDISSPVVSTCMSSSGSLTDVNHCSENPNRSVLEQNDPDSAESNHANTPHDSSTLRELEAEVPVHSRSESDLGNLPTKDPESNNSQLSSPKFISKYEEESLNISPKHTETISANRTTDHNFSAVHLTATTILELDEE